MSQPTSKRDSLRGVRGLGGILGLALLVLAPPAVKASPIRNHAISARSSRDLQAWSSFLAGGVQLWSSVHAPHISVGVRMAMAQALGTTNPRSDVWVQYLLWRHDLNPRRFDYWHPQLGPALENLPPLSVSTPSVTPKPSPQTTGNPPKTPKPNPSPGILEPPGPTVPEPDALTVSLALIGAGIWWRWRGAMRPARVSE